MRVDMNIEAESRREIFPKARRRDDDDEELSLFPFLSFSFSFSFCNTLLEKKEGRKRSLRQKAKEREMERKGKVFRKRWAKERGSIELAISK